MKKKFYLKTDEEKRAAEYLRAFIKHLYDKGKSGIEIARKLHIHTDLLDKLTDDETMLAEMKRRSDEYVKEIVEKYREDKIAELKIRQEYEISYFSNGKYQDNSRYLRNIDSWTSNHRFTNAVDYHYRRKRYYSADDIDVIVGLSTGVKLPEERYRFTDRDLSPEYKMRVMYDLSDGISVWEISEKYNCSQLAVRQTAAEHSFTIPVADDAVAERIVKAIKEGYDLELLKSRFRNFDVQKIRKLIEEHRILPVMEG
jgi:hypothetical protein